MSTQEKKQSKHRGTMEMPFSRRSEVNSVVRRAAGVVDQLERALSMLPHVDSHGYSPCPPKVLRDLYGGKDKCEQQVAAYIPRLREILHVCQQEVERCQKNLDRVRADAGRIRLKEIQGKYSQAEQALELQLRQAHDDRDAVFMVLKKAEVALEISHRRRIPKIRHRYDGGTAAGTGSGNERPDADSIGQGKASSDDDLDGLILLGPRLGPHSASLEGHGR